MTTTASLTTASPATPISYLWDNDHPQAPRQHEDLAAVLDAHSTAVLLAAGVRAGQRCLDVGAGGGSISTWLADRVGPLGWVDAVDTDPRFIPHRANLDVHAGNIVDFRLRPGSYDVIHARLILGHLPQREELVHRFADALAPGGVLVVSDWAGTVEHPVLDTAHTDAAELIGTYGQHLVRLLVKAGSDLGWALRANAVMRDAGLVDVVTLTDARSWTGGTGICRLHQSNSIALQDGLVAAGMTVEELDRLRVVLADPGLVLLGYLTHTTVGRRGPAGPQS